MIFSTPSRGGRNWLIWLALSMAWWGQVPCLAQCALWNERDSEGFPGRFGHGSTYDPAHGVVVSFGGGRHYIERLEDTRVWDGVQWRKVGQGGPPPGAGSDGMTYDEARGMALLPTSRLVSSGVLRTELWGRSGQYWVLLSTTGPSPEYPKLPVFDTYYRRLVVYQGTPSVYNVSITWEWNGVSWFRHLGIGPPIRAGRTAIAFDAERQVAVLVSGSETWERISREWVLRDTQAPGADATVAMVYDPGRKQVLRVDGVGKLARWSGTAWERLVTEAAYEVRWGYAAAFDVARDRLVVSGGNSTPTGGGRDFADTWEWDGLEWRKADDGWPTPRYDHAMAFDSARGATVMFGGTNEPTTWEFTNDHWHEAASTGPSPRISPRMVYDRRRGVSVLFGGHSFGPSGTTTGGVALEDTWEWNGSTWTRRVVVGPPARWVHAMAFDDARGVTVLFGGVQSAYSTLGDTWEWDGANWMERRRAHRPPPRASHAMAYDGRNQVVLLFGGGVQNVGASADTWEWDGSVWQRRDVPGPDPRGGHAMANSEAAGAIFLFGGSANAGNTEFSDTWRWDGSAWTRLTDYFPSARSFPALVADESNSRLLLFGGLKGGQIYPFPGTWELTGIQDTDRDGFPDLCDRCPQTRAGLPVDERGCATGVVGVDVDAGPE